MKNKPLPCPDYPVRCETAKKCFIEVSNCPYRKQKGKCCHTENIKIKTMPFSGFQYHVRR